MTLGLKCVFPENIPTHLMDGHWEFQGGGRGGLKSQIFLKESMKLIWNFCWGGVFETKKKKTSMGKAQVLSGTV